jgi:hypothetical protein
MEMSIEANGELTVCAKDKGTGKEQSILIAEQSTKTGKKPVLQHPPAIQKPFERELTIPPIDPPLTGVRIPPFPPNIYSKRTSPLWADFNFIPNYPSKKSVADWTYCPYCEQEIYPPLQSDAKCCPLCHHPLIPNQSHYPFGNEPGGYSSKRF